MALSYSYQGIKQAYNRALSFGQYTTAFAYHHVLGQGDRPCSGLSQGDLSTQLDWVSWFFGQSCSICLEGFEGSTANFLTCNHAFHRECLRGWLSVNSSCPNCTRVSNLGGIIDPRHVTLY